MRSLEGEPTSLRRKALSPFTLLASEGVFAFGVEWTFSRLTFHSLPFAIVLAPERMYVGYLYTEPERTCTISLNPRSLVCQFGTLGFAVRPSHLAFVVFSRVNGRLGELFVYFCPPAFNFRLRLGVESAMETARWIAVIG